MKSPDFFLAPPRTLLTRFIPHAILVKTKRVPSKEVALHPPPTNFVPQRYAFEAAPAASIQTSYELPVTTYEMIKLRPRDDVAVADSDAMELLTSGRYYLGSP